MAPHIKPALKSPDLATNPPPDVRRRLAACLNLDSAHIAPGSSGPQVQAIQDALKKLSAARRNFGLPDIADPPGAFGDTTAAAVRRYKDGANGANDRIVRAGAPLDDIVGRMTITQLDDDLVALAQPKPQPKPPAPPTHPTPPLSVQANVFVGHMGRAEPHVNLILEYYKNCGLETIGPAQLETAAVSRHQTFEALIDALIASTTLMNVVVNHGDTARGLLIKLCPETQFRDTGLLIGALLELADRRAKGPLDLADPDTALFMKAVTRQAQVSRAVVERIVNKLVRLRQKPLIVHLRACNQKTSFMASRYKRAFGALAVTFHGTRLIYQRLDPKIPVNHRAVANTFASLPASNQQVRFRLFQDPFGEIADMLVGVGVVLDDNGDVGVEDSVQLIDRRDAADLDGWAETLDRRWRAPTRKGFVTPIVWADEDDTSFSFPLEDGWRQAIKTV